MGFRVIDYLPMPLDVEDRDVSPNYVLKILLEGMLKRLAFKGGTCLKKTHLEVASDS
jgi:predicted nucleotidyltransferase component of viral defense system